MKSRFIAFVRTRKQWLFGICLFLWACASVYAQQTMPEVKSLFPPWIYWAAAGAGILMHYLKKLMDASLPGGKPVNPLTYFAGRPYRTAFMMGTTALGLILAWQTNQLADPAAGGLLTAFMGGFGMDSGFGQSKLPIDSLS